MGFDKSTRQGSYAKPALPRNSGHLPGPSHQQLDHNPNKYSYKFHPKGHSIPKRSSSMAEMRWISSLSAIVISLSGSCINLSSFLVAAEPRS